PNARFSSSSSPRPSSSPLSAESSASSSASPSPSPSASSPPIASPFPVSPPLLPSASRRWSASCSAPFPPSAPRNSIPSRACATNSETRSHVGTARGRFWKSRLPACSRACGKICGGCSGWCGLRLNFGTGLIERPGSHREDGQQKHESYGFLRDPSWAGHHYDIGGQEACRCNQNQRATVTLLTGAMCIVAQPLIVWAVQSPAQRSPADQQHRNGDSGDIVSHYARVQQECTHQRDGDPGLAGKVPFADATGKKQKDNPNHAGKDQVHDRGRGRKRQTAHPQSSTKSARRTESKRVSRVQHKPEGQQVLLEHTGPEPHLRGEDQHSRNCGHAGREPLALVHQDGKRKQREKRQLENRSGEYGDVIPGPTATLPTGRSGGEDHPVKQVDQVAAQNGIVGDQSGKKGNGRQHQRQPAAFASIRHLEPRPELKPGPRCDRSNIKQAQKPARKHRQHSQQRQRYRRVAIDIATWLSAHRTRWPQRQRYRRVAIDKGRVLRRVER